MNASPSPLADLSRRQFLTAASGSLAAAVAAKLGVRWLSAESVEADAFFGAWDFADVAMSTKDELIVPPGFEWEILLRTDEPIHPDGATFGSGNDFFAIIHDGPDSGWLWVNHEAPDMVELEEAKLKDRATEEMVLKRVGGSCIRVNRNGSGKWRPDKTDRRNYRIDATTKGIRLTGPAAGSSEIGGLTEVTGSLANCGGAISPWGTFFSGEENYYHFFGDPDMKDDKPGIRTPELQKPSEHYGWMLEVDPRTREVFKHTALGRFAHENIAFGTSKDGRLVAYMGDDRKEQCLYKYISRGKYDAAAGVKNRELLADGTLYAADTKNGRWLALTPDNPKLKEAGMDAAKICVRARKAAKETGATPLARPEYAQIHPDSGEVFTTLTSWVPDGKPVAVKEPAGAILIVKEKGGDHGAEEFEAQVIPTSESGLNWPDNLVLAKDRMLVTSDYKMGKDAPATTAQAQFGNNSLFVATVTDWKAKARRFCVGPQGSELCCPMMSPDGSELWLSVQHPGEGGEGKWPGPEAASAMVAIRRKGQA